MNIQDFTYLITITFTFFALIAIICAFLYPSMMDERLRRSFEALDQERIGKGKRYVVHYPKTRLMDSGAFICFVIMGLIFMHVPLYIAYSDSWSEVDVTLVIIGLISGITFAFLFPLGCWIGSLVNTAKFLVITDDGLEVWKINRKGVQMLYTHEWRDINRIAFNRQYQGLDAEQMYVFVGNAAGKLRKKHFILKTNWINMLSFLQDLELKVPDIVRNADRFTRARIDYSINNPKSEARKAMKNRS